MGDKPRHMGVNPKAAKTFEMPHALRTFLDTRWPTVIKYMFCLGIAGAAFYKSGNAPAFAISLFEIALTFFACNELCRWSRLVGSIASGVVLLLIDVQLLVLMFSNSFLTLIFISNMSSIEDLSGKMFVYLAAALVMLCFICLPIRHLSFPLFKHLRLLGCTAGIVFLLAAAEAASLDMYGFQSSPLFSYVRLANEQAESNQAREAVRKQPNRTGEFYHAEVADHFPKPAALPTQPNVVVIFAEGLSQDVIDDERDIMPNVALLEERSLSFASYFNHTFATYRGLMGQLFSGYQHENFDTNTLVSLPQIFESQGYQTAFINVEPGNREFYNYLTTLGFQEVIDYPDQKHKGVVPGHLSDREAFGKLFDEMERMGAEGQPFFIGMYTVGTHATFDSVDEKFEDGTDTELNKFYDLDYQFGEFLSRFEASPWFDDTVVVFTSDHCTYGDMYYTDAFPSHKRKSMEVDAIPMIIYHKGVKIRSIDVNGRNTTCMAPTLLDYLDLSAPNYFVGSSLFADNASAGALETFFSDGGMTELGTAGGRVHKLSETQQETCTELLHNYYAAKQQKPLVPDDAK